MKTSRSGAGRPNMYWVTWVGLAPQHLNLKSNLNKQLLKVKYIEKVLTVMTVITVIMVMTVKTVITFITFLIWKPVITVISVVTEITVIKNNSSKYLLKSQRYKQ